MKDKIKFHKKVMVIGGSIGITLPPEIREYLELIEGTEVSIMGENGKHGKYISIWRKEQDDS